MYHVKYYIIFIENDRWFFDRSKSYPRELGRDWISRLAFECGCEVGSVQC